MKHEGIDGLVYGLVGTAEAEKIRGDDALARGDKGGDHLAVEIGPGGLAMQAERDRRVARPFVEIMHAQAPGAVAITGNERIAGQDGKAFVRGAQSVHRLSPQGPAGVYSSASSSLLSASLSAPGMT